MYLIHCLVLISLFLISTSDHKVQVKGCFVGSVLPRSFRLASFGTNARCFPSSVKSRSLCVLLLLCGDISLNPGHIVMGVANCRSVRNKGPMISDAVFNHSLDILSLVETHICPTDTDCLLQSITPPSYKLCQRPRAHGSGGRVGFLINSSLSHRIVDHPTFSNFECLVVSIGSNAHSTLVACVYRPPGSCSNSFYDEFYMLVKFLSSTNSSFVICGDFNIHIETISRESVNFLNTLDSCNITQHVHSATHLHGHTLDLILTSDSSLVSNVVVSDYISDHAMIKCQVKIQITPNSQANRVTYRRYHKINMDTLRNDLSNCAFVACPGETAKILYDQYTNDLSNLLDKHAPEVTRCLAKEPAKWLSDTYKNAKSIRRQFERIWRKNKTPLNRARLRKQIARCNSLANKDKATYYRALVNENSDDPKKLWQVLRSTLHRIPDKVLPSHSSHKKLTDQPLFSPTRLPKSESLFPVLHLFPCHLL